MTTPSSIRKFPRNGVFDAIHRSESAALSMQDKRSAVEGLALNLAWMVSQ